MARQGGLVGGLIFLLIMLGMVYFAFKAVSGIFWILSVMAPIMFIAALVINHRVVTDYLKKIFRLLKEDTPKGLLWTAGTVIGYPVVAAWLAFKAFTTKGSKKYQKEKRKEKEYIKYEEVEESEDFLELPDLEEVKPKQGRSTNDYDDMFS